jgi:hypothetical protein
LEPLLGSAPHQELWLAVDCPKPWNSKVQKSTAFPSDVPVEELLESGLAVGLIGRVPLPRKGAAGEGATVSASRTLTAYRHRKGWEEATLPFEQAQRLVDLDALSWLPAQPTAYICTHGSRDSCCGRLGVPILQAWRERVDYPVYECSHLGGHRFAPTMLRFPGGRLYGRLTLEQVALEEKEVLDHLRGHSGMAPALQVIEAEIARLRGSFPEDLVCTSGGPDLYRFTCNLGCGRVRLQSQTHWGPQSCSDLPHGKGKESVSYRVQDITLED